MLSRSDVVAAVREVEQIVNTWEAAKTDEAPYVSWRGRPTKAISEAVADAFESLSEKTATMEVDRDARAVVLMVDKFDEQYVEWAEKSELTPEDANPGGSREMWSAWQDVIGSTADRPTRRLEPIKQLDIEKVPERQIALMYGWKHSDGSPDAQKVREERENPGTHYNAAEWVHPQDAKDDAETDAAWSIRSARIDAEIAQSTPAAAPESLDDLILQDVPSKQIARMLGITPEDVKARAGQMGVPLDGQFVPSISPHDRMQDVRDADADRNRQLRKAAESELRAAETDVDAMPERILSLAADGQNPKQIAKLLSGDFKGLTEAKVAGIIAHANQADSVVV